MDITLDAKQQISDWMKIARDCLHDISLEDVEVSAHALDNIQAATRQMTGESGLKGAAAILMDPFAVKSYWVATTCGPRGPSLVSWSVSQGCTGLYRLSERGH